MWESAIALMEFSGILSEEVGRPEDLKEIGKQPEVMPSDRAQRQTVEHFLLWYDEFKETVGPVKDLLRACVVWSVQEYQNGKKKEGCCACV